MAKHKKREKYIVHNGKHTHVDRKGNMTVVDPKSVVVGGIIPSTKYIYLAKKPLDALSGFKDHRRLKAFFYKGVECVSPNCSCVGTQLIQGLDHSGNLHWDVYTDDWILMTVDHIIPKSKGGTYDLENLNPMCSHCNNVKADK